MNADVIIVGAGIIGCALAEQLARRGRNVWVLDRAGIGQQTSAAGMGHLVALGDHPRLFALALHSLQLWQRRAGQLPTTVEYAACGTLWLASNAPEQHLAEALAERLARADVRSRWLNAAQLQQAEPTLATDLPGALLVPDDAVIYPPNACQHFAANARACGARFELGVEVVAVANGEVLLNDAQPGNFQSGNLPPNSFQKTNAQKNNAQKNNAQKNNPKKHHCRRLRAPAIVVAAGCATPRLLPQLSLLPRKGHLLITTRQVPRVQHQLVELGYHQRAHGHDPVSVAFNVQPRRTGQLLIGSSRQFDDESLALVPSVLQRMLQRAQRFMPALGQWPALRGWTGLRPCTPDNLPYLGQLAGDPTLWVATGHEGLGITTATGTAELLADQLCGDSPRFDGAAMSPNRDMGLA